MTKIFIKLTRKYSIRINKLFICIVTNFLHYSSIVHYRGIKMSFINVQINCCMLWDLFCQSFGESRNIKQVLFFLCAFSFYHGRGLLGKSHYCHYNFKIQKGKIRFVTDSINIDPCCTLLKQ